MFFCDLRVLARKLTSLFGHPMQVSRQGQLVSTCDYLPVRLARVLYSISFSYSEHQWVLVLTIATYYLMNVLQLICLILLCRRETQRFLQKCRILPWLKEPCLATFTQRCILRAQITDYSQTGQIIIVKVKSAHPYRRHLHFILPFAVLSDKEFLISPGWDASPSQGYSQH